MAIEIVVGVIGLGTAIVGLATAYVSRTRHIIHRHDLPEQPRPQEQLKSEYPDILLEIDENKPEPSTEAAEASDFHKSESNKYGIAAVRAAKLCLETAGSMSPQVAWETATIELFGIGTSSQRKGCPKGAFLGLCQEGYVAGIPRGEYSNSEKNRGYAVAAVELLSLEPRLVDDWKRLWERVLGGVVKQHNSQMHVVIALWQHGLLSVPITTRAEQKIAFEGGQSS